MALILARFLFGLALVLVCALVLGFATWLCLKLVRQCMLLLREPRHQDIASGGVILAIICLALWSMYAGGHLLQDALGRSPLVGGTDPDWLAGTDLVSASAILGAIAGLGLLAAIPALLRPREPREDAPASEAPAPPLPRAQSKPQAKISRNPEPGQRGPRRSALGVLALFLLALGGLLLFFAHIVAPLNLADGIPGAAPMIERAKPVYMIAAGLLAGGVCMSLLWWFWRAPLPPDDTPRTRRRK